jgi:uncharacterized protein (DUF362 family)
MSNYSRRDFLAHSAAAGMLAWQADRLLAAGDAAAARPADMAIARWKGPEPKDATDPQLAGIATKLTQQAIDALGGMRRFVKRGDVVWVKPNIGWDRKPEQAGDSNPQVVAALVAMCLEAGAKTVKVGDYTVHAAVKTYETSGIAPAVKTPGGKMVFLDKQRFKETAINGERIKTLLLYPEIIECDLVINAAIVKHHVLSNATLCMKNYMGVMDNRAPFHQDFAACLCDLTRFMKPRLCVLDAVRILKDHGPVGGRMEDVAVKTTVAAGVDIVALDALGLELMGKEPGETRKAASIIKYAEESGLGKANYRGLALKELAVT